MKLIPQRYRLVRDTLYLGSILNAYIFVIVSINY
jgi:hypothetical protein